MADQNRSYAGQPVRSSSPALIAVAWLVVLIPAGWGLTYTTQNALKIFTKAPAAVAPQQK